ncbi:MAG: hypothetical protein E7587_00010 [Ruminococcaceae bacterium]|nr:hypothetical protein [Oscillospiraceae bacterium]
MQDSPLTEKNATESTPLLNKISAFAFSDIAKAILFIIAATVVVCEKFVFGTLLFIVITSIILVLPKSNIQSLYPFLLLCAIAMRCYDSFDTFIVYWWITLIPIAAFITKLCVTIKAFKRKKSISLGKSFYGNLSVAIAVTLGGIGSISLSEYFAPMALYYVFFLGFGMIFFYIVAREGIFSSEENITELFCKIMYLVGLFCVFSVVHIYILNIPHIIEIKLFTMSATGFQWKNNVATFLMFCMPFPFYFARKNCLHFFSGVLMFAALVLTTSRGAIVLAPVEFIVCVVYAIAYNKKNIFPLIVSFALGAAALLLLNNILVDNPRFLNYSVFSPKRLANIIKEGETRVEFIPRAFEDFKSSPIFGKGLGNTANTDIYNPKKGALCWYHMMIPQIVGSLGTVGILAYGHQFVVRTALIFKKICPSTLCLGISYLGILLMSQVNPGEFCPLPYELLTVLIFIILERSVEKDNI